MTKIAGPLGEPDRCEFDCSSLTQCKSCDKSATSGVLECFECNDGYVKNPIDGGCIAKKVCSAGEYGDPITDTCKACTTNCEKCSFDATSGSSKCDYCDDTYKVTNTRVCAAAAAGDALCPSFFYADTTNRLCKKCSEHCKVCRSATTCRECEPGFDVNSDTNLCEKVQGESNCPELFGFHPEYKECVPCQPSCKVCSFIQNAAGEVVEFCNECNSDLGVFEAINGRCESVDCFPWEYFDPNQGCMECRVAYCAQCLPGADGRPYCGKCEDKFTETNGKCVLDQSACTGTGFILIGTECFECPPGCDTCEPPATFTAGTDVL